MSYTPEQNERLAKNYHTISSRLDEVANWFLTSMRDELDEQPALLFAMDFDHEQVVSFVSTIGVSFEDTDQLVDESEGTEAVLESHEYQEVREHLLDAIAWVSDYTWTSQLRKDWTLAFDLVPNQVLSSMVSKARSMAA